MDVNAVALLGMKADQTRLSAVSQNLANVLTPAYKKQLAINPVFAEHMAGLAAPAVAPTGFSPFMSLDPSPGAMRPTGEPGDVAIEGNAYFEVAGESGPLYTRQGSMRVDVRGKLVGPQGLPVMGTGGEITLANLPFSVSPTGEVRQGGRAVGTLKLVKFERAAALEPRGQGLYGLGGATIADQGKPSTLRSGFAEGSNVQSPQEMVRLAETIRHFEALQKVVQGYDGLLEQTIRKLGEF